MSKFQPIHQQRPSDRASRVSAARKSLKGPEGTTTSTGQRKSGVRGEARPTSGEESRVRTVGYTNRPSAGLNTRRQANPFASSSAKHKTNFSYVYANGGIPCRINHGGVKHRLQWNTPPEELSFDPMLITFAEGLSEIEHPYVFVSRNGFMELLDSEGALDKVVPLLGSVVRPLRVALMQGDEGVVKSTLEAVGKLSSVVGSALNPHLPFLLVPISKCAFKPKFKNAIASTLQVLEENGGEEAFKTIKAKVPTYTTVYM